jgi:hypothetical protein
VGPRIQENFEDEVEMTDNPLNDEFEKKMVRIKDLSVIGNVHVEVQPHPNARVQAPQSFSMHVCVENA